MSFPLLTDTSPISGFADDPFAPHSAQFPTGQLGGPVDSGPPSPETDRPWGLRGMHATRCQDRGQVLATYTYDHTTQTAVTADGRPLVMAEPTAKKNTSNDGDEGPSEDYSYDFCPDEPLQV